MVEKTKVETMKVDLGDRSYPICIGAGNLSQFDLESYIHGDKALIVTNESIAPLYLERIKARVKNKSIDIMGRPPTRQKELKDGWYVEVRNKGSKTGMKIRRETLPEMEQMVKDYQRTKEVIILGESRGGKFVDKDGNVIKKKKR